MPVQAHSLLLDLFGRHYIKENANEPKPKQWSEYVVPFIVGAVAVVVLRSFRLFD